MPNTFFITWSILLGLVFGSFANVLILRDDDRMSILTGRSRCPHCKHALRWYELLPVLSFILQGGRCRACKHAISWQYPLVELMAGGLAGIICQYALLHGAWVAGIGLFVAALLFLVISCIDIRTMTVPIDYCVAAGVIGALSRWISGELSLAHIGYGLLIGAGSIVIVTVVWRLLFKQEGMGSGDAWIAGSIGMVVGYPGIVISLLAAVFLGAIVGVMLVGLSRKSLQTAVPFGPFLSLGLLVGLFWGQRVWDWYTLAL